MLKMQSLSKVYRTEMIETYALREFNLEVREGEFVAVTGPSGSGKTTFLNICGLLEEFTGGEYWLDGVDVRGLDDNARSRLRNEKIGFIFQQFNLLPKLTALENVELPMIYSGLSKSARRERAMAMLEKLGMAERSHHKPSELSGGQQQRVAISRALATKPALILADEPTGALDSRTGQEVLELIMQLNEQGNTIVLITHDNHIAEHAKRIVSIRDGEIVSDIVNATQRAKEAVRA